MNVVATKTGPAVSRLLGYSGAKLIPGAILFLSIPLLIHAFGLDAYGTYARTWTATMLITSAGFGWIKQSVLRATGMQGRGLANLSRMIVLLAFVATSAVSSAYAILESKSSGSPMASLILATNLLSISTGVYFLGETVAQRDGSVAKYTLGATMKAAGAGILPLALAGSGAPRGALIIGCAALGNLAGMLPLIKPHPFARATHSSATAASWRYGAPMSVWLVLSTLTMYTDRFVVSFLWDPTTAGRYAAVSDIVVRGVGMLTFPITMAAHPEIMMAANSGSIPTFRSVLRRWRLLLGSSIVVVALVYLVLERWLSATWTIFGQTDRLTVWLLLLASSIWQYALMAHKVHEATSRTKTMVICIGVACLLGLATQLALTPTFGPSGAALGVAVGAGAYLVAIGLSRPRTLDPVDLEF